VETVSYYNKRSFEATNGHKRKQTVNRIISLKRSGQPGYLIIDIKRMLEATLTLDSTPKIKNTSPQYLGERANLPILRLADLQITAEMR
ncbi:MAG: hypothetical protein ACK5Q2_15720, partial [Bacteroidota bacterium]